MLVLPIKKQWFEMIASGVKKEEYREIKPHYDKCLGNQVIGFPFNKTIIERFEEIKKYDPTQFKNFEVIFRNGYRKDSPKIKCKCKLKIGQGRVEWGAEPNINYYILEILEIIGISNWNIPNPNSKQAMAVATLPATKPITATEEIQSEIVKAINKQFSIGIDIGEGISKTGQAIKNVMRGGIY